MEYHNYYSVLDNNDIKNKKDDKNRLCNEVMGCEDIIFEIISNSPWLLVSLYINKTWNKISKNIINNSSKLDFIELCKQNHYLAVRHLLINYYKEYNKLYRYSNDFPYFIDSINYEIIEKYNNNYYKSELKESDNKKLIYEFDNIFYTLKNYSDGWSDRLFDNLKIKLKDRYVSGIICNRKIIINRGLYYLLCNTNNPYTLNILNVFINNKKSIHINGDIVEISINASNDKVYKYMINKYPKTFHSSMTTHIFYSANIKIIDFYLKIKNTTDNKIKDKYGVYHDMHEYNDWSDALFCSLAVDHYEGVKIALKYTSNNDSGISCITNENFRGIDIKDERIKELVKDITCSLCNNPMTIHFV